jgi:TIR domain-containing protein
MTDTLIQRTKVFVSYSHQDKEWLKRLRVHLKPLESRYGVDVWADTDIKPGSKWRDEIERALATAKVAVLLISADFIASDFIEKSELPPLLRAAEAEGAVILPLILSPSMYSRIDELAQFQAINDPSMPLVELSKGQQEQVLVSLTEAIENALGYSPEKEPGVERELPNNRRRIAEGPTNAPRLPGNRRIVIPPAIGAAIFVGLIVIAGAYWQFIYKSGRAQLVNYTGRVTDTRTNKPIHNAKVAIEADQNVPQIQHTDSEGIFHVVLRDSTGVARIRVDAEGYDYFDRNVQFSRTGVEPISLTAPSPSPTPATAQASPRPTGRRQRPRPGCTAEDMLLGKC